MLITLKTDYIVKRAADSIPGRKIASFACQRMHFLPIDKTR